MYKQDNSGKKTQPERGVGGLEAAEGEVVVES